MADYSLVPVGATGDVPAGVGETLTAGKNAHAPVALNAIIIGPGQCHLERLRVDPRHAFVPLPLQRQVAARPPHCSVHPGWMDSL